MSAFRPFFLTPRSGVDESHGKLWIFAPRCEDYQMAIIRSTWSTSPPKKKTTWYFWKRGWTPIFPHFKWFVYMVLFRKSNIFYFHPYLGKIPILTHIFQRGWFNHQLEKPCRSVPFKQNGPPCFCLFASQGFGACWPCVISRTSVVPPNITKAQPRGQTLGDHGNQQGIINPTFKEFLLQYSRWVKQMRRLLQLGRWVWCLKKLPKFLTAGGPLKMNGPWKRERGPFFFWW